MAKIDCILKQNLAYGLVINLGGIMIRSWQERDTLVRRLEECVPYLKTLQSFAWTVPHRNDPIYHIYPSDFTRPDFRYLWINIKTGEYSGFKAIDWETNTITEYAPGCAGPTDQWIEE